MLALLPWTYFIDPVLRAPTLGCMLMCLSAALVGVVTFVRRKSLIGETLSHASYPGVVFAVLLGACFIAVFDEPLLTFFVLIGALISSLLGLWVIDVLEKRFKVYSDAALCAVLSTFFGVGLTITSHMQFSNPRLYQSVQVYFYGQAATLTDEYIVIYGILSLVVVGVVIFLYKEIQATYFDRSFAKSIAINTRQVDVIILIMVVVSIVIGIRSVGFVLMSAMLIAPPVAARQFTHKLSTMFGLSALFGVVSGYLGNYFSVELSTLKGGRVVSWPTGPMIVLVAVILCLLSMLFAPGRGMVSRCLRIVMFRFRCVQENILKAIWRCGVDGGVSISFIADYQSVSKFYLKMVVIYLCFKGWLEKVGDRYHLTQDGCKRAAHIVRLHRLWEVYLVDYLGWGVERVHLSAEEMEHIITPELEKRLVDLMHDPLIDPHHQPIPPRDNTI